MGSTISYEGGSIKYKDWCDIDFIRLMDIDGHVLALGCSGYMDYFWCCDLNNLKEDAKPLKSEVDELEMAKAAVENGNYVHIYILYRSDFEVEKKLEQEKEGHKPFSVVIEELNIQESAAPTTRPKKKKKEGCCSHIHQKPLLVQ